MGGTTRPNHELAACGRNSSRRYRLIRLDEGHKTAEVETERDLHLGDHVDVRGRRYEIVGLAWKRNYTVPVALNMTSATMGFGPELEHFRRVVTEGIPNESDIASAAATLALTSQIAEQAFQG